VVTWKDQSGNGNDATAASGQEPTIYTGGALVKENGKVAFTLADGDGFSASSSFGASSQKYAFLTHSVNSSDTSWSLYAETIAGNVTPLAEDGSTSTTLTSATYNPLNAIYKDGNTLTLTTRDALHNDYTSAGRSLTVMDFEGTASVSVFFNRSGGRNYTGTAQELIFYTSDKSSVRTQIESNIGDYFTQNTPLLDTYSGAAAAYSLRKLRTAYTGDAVEVYNGSSYADIGFNVFGELDTVALAAHCGSNDGFVSKWYDQAGSNDAVQTTTASRPKIYDGTTGVVTENGKPALSFDGGDDFLTPLTSAASDYTLHAVTKNSATGSYLFDSQSGRLILEARGTNRGVYFDGGWQGTSHTGINQQLQSIYAVAPSSGQSYVNGTQINTGVSYTQTAIGGTTRFGGGYFGGSRILGSMQEFIFYASDQSSNRTNIEDNINTFYNIY
jgi:hypothetical protein